MKKEITVFTQGDASLASTWSNVPYFLTTTLEEKGYTVHRINVESSGLLQKLYDKFLCRVLRHTILPHTTFCYERSYLYDLKVRHLIRKAIRKYPSSDYYISTSFSFSPKEYTDRPCVLFCDWTYEYYINHFNHKKPDFLERPAVKRQDMLIESADYVFSLFPDVTQYMQTYYRNPHIAYLGNVINSDEIDTEIDFVKKQANHKILFIGLKKYKEGAKTLIQSVIRLHSDYPDIELHFIGMVSDDCGLLNFPEYIHFHGYLSKDVPSQKELYYSLLHDSAVYVNTTPLWAGFSSALESLYHYLPVVTSPYKSFLDTFGEDLNFGYYCNENIPDKITDILTKIFDMPVDQYKTLCENAHKSTLDYTWSAYVEKMLTKISSITSLPPV